MISKLSETYTERTTFGIDYINPPDSLLFTNASKESVGVRLSANGFQFFYFNIGKQAIKIDLSKINTRRGKFYVTKDNYRAQIERQLPGNMTLLDVDEDTLFVKFEKLHSKQVAVVADITLQLAPNHLLEGILEIEPPSIEIKGPESEIREINEIRTVSSTLTDVSEDFKVTLDLARWASLSNTTYSQNTVEIQGNVFRFSEQMIDIPVKVVNVPEGVEVRTFPNTISALCKARIDRLKNLRPQEFELVADFQLAEEGKQELDVILMDKPDDVYDAQLSENKVEFILIRR